MFKSPAALAAYAVLALVAAPAHAVVVTQWNFNSVPPDASTSTGSTAPSIGSGTAALVGGTTATFASGVGSTDLAAADNTGWNTTAYPASGADKTAGAKFSVSTVGFNNVVVSWDQRHSNTSSKYVAFQYTIDGTTFLDVAGATGLFTAGTGDTWFTGRSVDLTGIAGVANNANFGFRVVSTFGPGNASYVASTAGSTYGSGGTMRFDMVTVNAAPVPEPETWALMLAGVGAMVFVARRRA
jgi:PEP-CTERM motif